MVLNKFFINVFVRVTLIGISCVLLGIVLPHTDQGYFYTLAGIVFLIVLQNYLLVIKVNKTNTDLEKFFASAQNLDTSIRFPKETGKDSFRQLHERMNAVNSTIQKARTESQRASLFLESLVNHVDVGLISFDNTEKIEILNRAAGQYLNVHQPCKLASLKAKDKEMYKIITNVKPGKEILLKKIIDNNQQSILVKATDFGFENQNIRLVSLQNITSELDKKELDSWRKLIRVLTHEIMNSISPITSLTTVISAYFQKKDEESPVEPGKIDSLIISKTLSGLATIEETGKRLLDFVDKYRSLSSLPKPEISRFSIYNLFQRCKLLMESDLPKNTEIFISVHPEHMMLEADDAQVEQILINLVKNAMDALKDKKDGIINLKSFSSDESIIIQVEDNGTGISNNIMEDIFVPFYTTKKDGSGIGLSLSRQIMQNHQGTISVNSVLNKGTVFILKFPLKT